MTIDTERNLGEQPIAQIMLEHSLKPHDLVANSAEHLTHKMVSRACKGRWLTPNVQAKLLKALAKATGKAYTLADLFTYAAPRSKVVEKKANPSAAAHGADGASEPQH
jgi:hypothetical protein